MTNKNYSIFALFLFLSVSLFSPGCKKDKDDSPRNGKKAKITISVSSAFNKAQGDDFQLIVSGGNQQGGFVDWKIDGKTEKGTAIFVGSDYVNGGKDNLVAESIQDFEVGSVSISSFNIQGAPFTVSYKVEVNGTVKDEQTVVIETGDDPLLKSYNL